jgi:AraC family transcriptional regulator
MLSPDHFSRSFSVSFGMPPHRYVQKRRIEAASRMLRSERSIVDIALELGFYSHTHFTRVFREHTGTTPTRLRSTFV